MCPQATYVWNVRPHKVLETTDYPIGHRDVTYHWHLAPDG